MKSKLATVCLSAALASQVPETQPWAQQSSGTVKSVPAGAGGARAQLPAALCGS